MYATLILPKKNQKERARGTSKQSSESSNRIAQDMYATKIIPKKNQTERAREQVSNLPKAAIELPRI
jgi:hypothetical protein